MKQFKCRLVYAGDQPYILRSELMKYVNPGKCYGVVSTQRYAEEFGINRFVSYDSIDSGGFKQWHAAMVFEI